MVMLTLSGCSLALLLLSQQVTPYVSAAEIEGFLKKARAGNLVDQLVTETVVDGHKVAVAFLRRVKPETNALIHNHVTEIYQIVQGSGTLITGGTLSGSKPNDLTRLGAGIGQSGTHAGGESQKVGAGDVAIVPAGTPHRFSELSGEIIYMVYRFDSQASKP
jgi:mannose-6-phosphate isomerase-like protein (cupin superfamily)